MYLQNCSQEDKRKASPMQNELPEEIVPAYGSWTDCLHDEGAAYADRLKDAGGSVMLIDTKGTIRRLYDGALESQKTRKPHGKEDSSTAGVRFHGSLTSEKYEIPLLVVELHTVSTHPKSNFLLTFYAFEEPNFFHDDV